MEAIGDWHYWVAQEIIKLPQCETYNLLKLSRLTSNSRRAGTIDPPA